MDLRQLRYFVAVAEEMSFRRAAERLAVSQPPLSLQVKKLEEELGVQLFVRGKRRISLTSSGQVLLESARKIIADEQRANHEVRRAASGETGRLVIGCTDDFIHDLLPRALAIMHRERPGVIIETRIGSTLMLARGVANYTYDIALGCPPIPADLDTLDVSVIDETPIVAIVPSDHAMATRQRVSVAELWREPFVWAIASRETGYMLSIAQFVRRIGSYPHIVHQSSSSELVSELVAEGIGVALVAANSVNADVPGVVQLALEDADAFVRRAIIRRSDLQSAVTDAFVETVRAVLR